MWDFIMHMHPLLFLGCFAVIVPVIYIAIGTLIVLTRPAARDEKNAAYVDPWLLAWLTGEGTRVIQLAMFSLLQKNYLSIPEAGMGLANGRYSCCEMNVIERILFAHFDVRKPCHEDLPSHLSIAGRNIWQTQIQNSGLVLSPLRYACNLLIIGIPSLALGAILVCKLFICFDLITYDVLSVLLTAAGSVLWLGLWLDAIAKTTRLDFNGISHNDVHACLDALRAKLARNSDEMDDATAMLFVAVNGVDALPEHYREYKTLIGPVSSITSLRTED